MPTTITTRVENFIVRDIDHIAENEAIDRSAVIRKFLVQSLHEWKIQQHLGEYQQGKITLWQAARKCHLSLWEIIDEVKKRKIRVPYGLEELREDFEAL